MSRFFMVHCVYATCTNMNQLPRNSVYIDRVTKTQVNEAVLKILCASVDCIYIHCCFQQWKNFQNR